MGAAGSQFSDGVNEAGFQELAPDQYSGALFNDLKGTDNKISALSLERFLSNATDAFISYAMCFDELDRNSHKRVRQINDALQAAGLRTWYKRNEEEISKCYKSIEERDYHHRENLNTGISSASCVVVFITEEYIHKANGIAERGELDKVFVQFQCIERYKQQIKIIPVVMEPCCKDLNIWRGPNIAALRNIPFIDCSLDPLDTAIAQIIDAIRGKVRYTVNDRLISLKLYAYVPNGALAAALQHGKKQWKQGRIMIVGEGRAGKTALANSIVGKGFIDTESTVGINQMVCDVNTALVDGGEWNSYEKPAKELEYSLAALMRNTTNNSNNNVSDQNHILDALSTRTAVSGITIGEVHDVDKSYPHSSSTVDPRVVIANNKSPANHSFISTSSNVDSIKNGLDVELIMKYVEAPTTNDNIVITVSDYGGQPVFNVIHHLFLTPSGIYLVVFNMDAIVAGGVETEQCLNCIKFWINSITVHTFNSATKSVAPIVLVGTRKDKVPDLSQHETISMLLYTTFKSLTAWASVIPNSLGQGVKGRTTLSFFPIDNTIHRNDATMGHLLSTIETAMDKSPYIHKDVPLSWFKCLDNLNGHNQCYLSLKEVRSIAVDCGITESDEIVLFLLFLHDMGVIMWHNEDNLRDVVVLDPIRYFVDPATLVICKHNPDLDDATNHGKAIHRECMQQCYEDWPLFVERGLITRRMLNSLWSEYDNERRNILTKLCIKFGLFVPIRNKTSLEVSKYLVPALFPSFPGTRTSQYWCDGPIMSCYFVFTPYSNFIDCRRIINFNDLHSLGFLPSGIFERIVGSALSWGQVTAKNSFSIGDAVLYNDFAILVFGSVRFSLTALPRANCIRIDIEARSPLMVLERMVQLTRTVLDDCMKSLHMFPTLLHPTGKSTPPTEDDCFSFFSGKECEFCLLPLDVIHGLIHTRSELHRVGGRRLLTDAEAKARYGCWIRSYELLENYDVFISYRWGDLDDRLVESMFDAFSNECLSSECNRQIEVFLDKRRLKPGRRFDSDFARALNRSFLILPIVSVEALLAMKQHNKNRIDNLLLEWIMALHCKSLNDNHVIAILPILIGTREYKSGDSYPTISDLFAMGILSELSDEVPEATLNTALQLLQDNGISVEHQDRFLARTVKQIVDELLKFLSHKTWEIDPCNLIKNITETATSVLETALRELQHRPTVSPSEATQTSPLSENDSSSVKTNLKSTNPRLNDLISASGAPLIKYAEAWDILNNSKYVLNSDALAALFAELCLEDAAGLEFLDQDALQQLSSCLKAVPKGIFNKKLQS